MHLFTFLVIFLGQNLSWHAEAGELKRLEAGKEDSFGREGGGGGGVTQNSMQLSSY
jgi:hypothetical protein